MRHHGRAPTEAAELLEPTRHRLCASRSQQKRSNGILTTTSYTSMESAVLARPSSGRSSQSTKTTSWLDDLRLCSASVQGDVARFGCDESGIRISRGLLRVEMRIAPV